MGYFFEKGERKVRPGLYQRYENRGQNPVASALVGYCAIVIQADWGPLNEAVTITDPNELERIYGTGGSVADAMELFNGGANTVHVSRVGTGGTAASTTLTASGGSELVSVTSLYPGTRELTVSVQNVLGDDTKKNFIVMAGTTVLEQIPFVTGDTDAQALVDAVNAYRSDFVKVELTTDGLIAPVLQKALENGVNPTVTAQNYSTALNALEALQWNTVSVDTEEATVQQLLVTFMKRVYKEGRFGMAVLGDSLSKSFKVRCENAAQFDSELVVYFGSGWKDALGVVHDGHKAINRVAGIIASTTSSKSITHLKIDGAVDVAEKLTNSQHILAIENGCLTLAVGPEKQVWFDSGVNTLQALADNQDAGWKKIKRVAIRNELMLRMDQTLAPKVGRVNNDPDGRADVIQAGQNVLNAMVAEGGKILSGATFYQDPNNEPQGDEAWFIIDADDIDALEKIYLVYRYRYSQSA